MPSVVSHLFSRPSSSSAAPAEEKTVSDFDWRFLPPIHRRTPHPWSVHNSDSARFVATIARVTDAAGKTVRHLQFQFPTERAAHKFARAYAPPKLVSSSSDHCGLCDAAAPRHCRNCGVAVCEACSRRWGIHMVPKTFVYNGNNYPASLTVRVCKSCDWLSNAFCMALLQGRAEDAYRLYDLGNVNLRTSFADINREAMFPIHCAVMGGSLELVRWLIDTHLCPLFAAHPTAQGYRPSLATSAGRTVLDFVMSGRRPKPDLLHYLVVVKGVRLQDLKDTTLALHTLESLLKSGGGMPQALESSPDTEPALILDDDAALDDSVALQDPCTLCCDRETDCVLLPCGHQMCCTECGAQLTACPACKVPCTVLRIFRQ